MGACAAVPTTHAVIRHAATTVAVKTSASLAVPPTSPTEVDMRELGDLEVESAVQHEYGLTKRAAEVCFHSANIRPGQGLRGLEQVGEGKRLLLLCDDTHFRAVFIIWDKGFILDSLGPRIGGMRGANQ